MLHNALYAKSDEGYNPQFVTKLLWNYRWEQGHAGQCRARGATPLLMGAVALGMGQTHSPGCLLPEESIRLFLHTVLPPPGPTRPSSRSPTSSSMTVS